MSHLPPVVGELAERLRVLGWVPDLLVAGSLATGDHVPGVSDIDLVAVVDGPVDAARRTALTAVHRGLDTGAGAGDHLGCVYVDSARRLDPAVRHPTWTHGAMTRRVLSGITRAELVRHGFAVTGRAAGAVPRDECRRPARRGARRTVGVLDVGGAPAVAVAGPVAARPLADVDGQGPAHSRHR